MITSADAPAHRPFTLVLSGGGARGFAHLGVLRALEAEGYRPAAIVGVSMGAVVGVTYALRRDWYRAVLEVDTHSLPGPVYVSGEARRSPGSWLHEAGGKVRSLFDVVFGWGPGARALPAGRRVLRSLTAGGRLEEARVPVAVSTTDLTSGRRCVLRTGEAAEALYASIALAGILPPLEYDGRLLADGVYADIAPIDVARAFGHPVVIAVDPGQALVTTEIRHGYQALLRAVEVCQLRHADLRFAEADLVLRPAFTRVIDTLDFGARRDCTAAGLRVVRRHREVLHELLRASPYEPAPHRQQPAASISHGRPVSSSLSHSTRTEAHHGMAC